MTSITFLQSGKKNEHYTKVSELCLTKKKERKRREEKRKKIRKEKKKFA